MGRMVDSGSNLIDVYKRQEKLVTHGMLVEHDLGRLYTMQLGDAVAKVMAGDDEAKLDIIGNAIGLSLIHI